MNKKRVLVIYTYIKFFRRSSAKIHLESFEKFSNEEIYYHNIERYELPKYLLNIKFDLIIFHTSFLINRWNENRFLNNIKKCIPLKNINAKKVILPQDEHFKIDFVIDFIKEFKIDKVYSVSPKKEWKNIYKDVFNEVEIESVLTGYIDTSLLKRINPKKENREIDIGYRVKQNSYSLGKQGYLKVEIANIFNDHLGKRGDFNLDISTDVNKTILEDKWYDFLLNCKYTLGVESGSSIIDRDGQIHKSIEGYISSNEDIGFYKIQEKFLENDEEFEYYALSPRHLEACFTNTCQVLIEGDYSGVLKEGYHYISVKRDFSNIEDVIVQLKDEKRRKEIVDNAYKDVVESGLYTYEKFVEQVLNSIKSKSIDEKYPFEYYLTRIKDWYFWKESAFLNFIGYYK